MRPWYIVRDMKFKAALATVVASFFFALPVLAANDCSPLDVTACGLDNTCFWNVSVCEDVCGNIRQVSEACDDGGTANGDGCSSICEEEPYWTCSGAVGSVSSCEENPTWVVNASPDYTDLVVAVGWIGAFALFLGVGFWPLKH